MKYAVIAAGEGSRLAQEGIHCPKPLVEVGGESLLDRLLRIFCDNGASEIAVVCNDLTPLVHEHLLQIEHDGLPDGRRVPLRHIVRTTPSSMHSFAALAPLLEGEEPFIMTTVDTFFEEDAFAEYVRAFETSDADGMMAVTDYVDDEKPLWVATDGNDITGFLDADADGQCRYISAGIYGLRPVALRTLHRCMKKGQSRMRNFQRGLIEDGLNLKAWPLGKVFDIDHASDIPRVAVGIYRHRKYSPAKSENDRRILDIVLGEMQRQHYIIYKVTEEELLDGTPLRTADIYVSMARSEEVLAMLDGKKCVNTTSGIRCCNRREWMTETRTYMLPCWVKRADGCAEVIEDTMLCLTAEEKSHAIKAIQSRGITRWVEQPHYHGDLIKFYGVAGTDFFHWSYPTETGQTKFGLEDCNDEVQRHDFLVGDVKQTADDIALRIGVPVYGGDAIVKADGTFAIIDFNDWPTFSPCCKEAATAIATIAE